MRRPLVAGNWKLNGGQSANAELIKAILAGLSAATPCDTVVCPPFVYLREVGEGLRGTRVELGAQNVAAEREGAFTGEVSAGMLADVGCRFVIVGHSERRALYGETDAVVARKFCAARTAGLRPILCVGETLAEREAGATGDVVRRQLEAVLGAAGVDAFATSLVAYEPVWAIGTGRTATPEQAQEVHAGIRQLVAARSVRISAQLRILYGGSVKGTNAAALFAMPDIDGGLIGGASLVAGEFLEICRASASKS